MDMAHHLQCWSPYGGYYSHSSPWIASPSPYYGHFPPAPLPVYGYAPPGLPPSYGFAPACGCCSEVGDWNVPANGAQKVFEEMAPAVFESTSTPRSNCNEDSVMQSPTPSATVMYYDHVEESAHQIFDARTELHRRVLSVTLQHQTTPLPAEVVRLAFAPYGVVERVAYSAETPKLQALVQFQNRLMAVEAAEALQGEYIPGTACQLEILFARESELQIFQNEDAFQKNSDQEISQEETKWEQSSVMDIKIYIAVRKIEDMFQRWEHEKRQRCEQEELEQELEYFLGHAFDLLEEELTYGPEHEETQK